MEVRDTDYIGVRVPVKLRELMREYLHLDTHLNEAEFVRTAIREKIQRDAPRLRERMFEIELNSDTISKTTEILK